MENEINDDLYREIPVEEEDMGSSLMEDPFNPAEIDIDVKSPTIYNLIDRLSQTPPEIDLYADFQRSDDLWEAEKQSRLIESILIKFPLPAFYFDGSDDEKWLVVDGLQRLTSLKKFVIDKELTLNGLEFLKDLEGKTYDELPRTLKRTIDSTQVTAYIIKPGTPDQVKYNIFKRINTGGLVLTSQEIRHALNQGIPSGLVADLAGLDAFKLATGNKIASSRMLDREFVTRFVAFYIHSPEEYVPDLDSFLNRSMARIASLSKRERGQIKENFIKSMETAHGIFNDWAFRNADLYPLRRKPINKALFEVWSVALAKLPRKDCLSLITEKERVLENFAELCKDDSSFRGAISSGTGKKNKVVTRFQKIQNLVSEVLLEILFK
ncbi:conserved hypothetical protein [Candidatus Desulfarcum epimagneticum]|uniref:GmrSD restriction endonucleases N-terminal domain-containing protein n=1 Tax=uncultured Desulfobacteraceae bacterium TaxID=218296 RepID=A0A484HFZ6_9BACT|nr:conserved hypothetical protein [uncultured Desulfobacteraceae bacterium]